jgi:methionine synthase I (cobalamin-dependent)
MTRLLGAPIGTELARRGFMLAPPAWSAAAIDGAPDLLLAIHRDHVAAGADLVVANTTCARPCELGDDAPARYADAVAVAKRVGVPVVATIAMLPRTMAVADRTATYAAMTTWAQGADVLLLEGFVDPGELERAIEATAAWTRARWAALAGGAVDQLSSAIVRRGASGIAMWAVHCCAVSDADAALRQVDRAHLGGASLGAWPSPPPDASPDACASELGALVRAHDLAVVGCCCGGTPAHLAALRRHWT